MNRIHRLVVYFGLVRQLAQSGRYCPLTAGVLSPVPEPDQNRPSLFPPLVMFLISMMYSPLRHMWDLLSHKHPSSHPRTTLELLMIRPYLAKALSIGVMQESLVPMA